MSTYNIVPVNDLEDHVEDSTCKCKPSVEFVNGNMIITHNSFDGRENMERLIDITTLNSN